MKATIIAHWDRSTRIQASLGLMLVVITVVLRVVAAQRSWLWYDEYYSAAFATSFDLQGTLKAIQSIDYHPPLYYLQLRVWASASNSLSWLLLNSVMWSLLASLGCYFAARDIAGVNAGLCALALAAVMPAVVKEGAELRMYAMLMGLAAWGVFASLRLLTSQRPWPWAVLAAGLALALAWSHGAGLLWFLCWAVLSLVMVFMRADTHPGLRAFLYAFAIAGAGALPCLLEAVRRRPGHLSDAESADWAKLVENFLPGVDGSLGLSVLGALALRRKERVPRIPPAERRGKWKKSSGHRWTLVTPRK